jgi:hypothetical protein
MDELAGKGLLVAVSACLFRRFLSRFFCSGSMSRLRQEGKKKQRQAGEQELEKHAVL